MVHWNPRRRFCDRLIAVLSNKIVTFVECKSKLTIELWLQAGSGVTLRHILKRLRAVVRAYRNLANFYNPCPAMQP